MNGLPDLTIPAILSFLGVKEIHRCACISKQWTFSARQTLIEIKQKAVEKRAKKYVLQKVGHNFSF